MNKAVSKTDSPIHRFTHSPFFIALWLALLFLPFKGLKAAGILFIVLFAAVSMLNMFKKYVGTMKGVFSDFKQYLLGRSRIKLPESKTRSIALTLLMSVVVMALPFYGHDYLIDIAVLSGIYIILAQGLNIVVGFTGLLNLGFVAFYAIGAYSYALLNTKLGMGFWASLPLSVMLVTLSGFILAIPALRLRGDYLAIVTLGFGEIVRLVLNNWDSFTKGPNGIGGIEPPNIFGMQISKLGHFYYFIIIFVLLAVFIIRRVSASRIGRAWIAIREDEIASSSIGINTTAYKLYSFAFGAFWAGLAGVLFAAKMQFVSPESFTFMESVLVLCMVILGGLGSIPGVVLGAIILVMLPEMLREVQLYRMLALGSGLVMLMIFRPQGLMGGKGVSFRG
ncbi:MAG: branched-chain amino acid ABC transporter permease [Nitrospirae bacterium]|nr:branched-chain amino acid ABC transporter permease [Nitrospirota bacterium]